MSNGNKVELVAWISAGMKAINGEFLLVFQRRYRYRQTTEGAKRQSITP
jgi:hypothetical protein